MAMTIFGYPRMIAGMTTPDGVLTFGELLERTRMERGLSQNELAADSGVPASSVNRFEHGTRGVPTVQTIYNLAMGLGLPRSRRLDFLERGFALRILDDLQKFAIYQYLAMLEPQEAEAIIAPVRAELESNPAVRAVLERHNLNPATLTAEDLLTMLAEDESLRHLRDSMAPAFVNRLSVNLRDGHVAVDHGAIARALYERLQTKAEANETVSAALPDAVPSYLRRAARRSHGT